MCVHMYVHRCELTLGTSLLVEGDSPIHVVPSTLEGVMLKVFVRAPFSYSSVTALPSYCLFSGRAPFPKAG